MPDISATNPKIYRSEAMTFHIGKFKFVKHELRLTTQKEVDEFEEVLKSLDAFNRTKVKTVDLAAANALALQHKQSAAHRGGMHSGVKPATVDAINMHNAEDMARAGMTPEQIAAAKIAVDPDQKTPDMLPIETTNSAAQTPPAPQATNSLAALAKKA